MKKNNIPFIPVGISSLLITFLILCLSVFSILSLSSAIADQKLGQKSADRTLEYYDASNRANDTLASVDQCLAEASKMSYDKTSYFQQVKAFLAPMYDVQFTEEQDNASVSWNTAINDSQVLSVRLLLPYPVNEGEHFYTISQWKVINTDDWTPDQSQHVYRRNEEEGK